MSDSQAIIRRLTAERDEARETVAQLLERFAGTAWTPPEALGLSARQQEVLAVLVKRPGVVKTEQLHTVLYSLRPERDAPQIETIKMFVFLVRKKLRRFGLEIETVWGEGWRLPDATRQRLLNWTMEPVSA